MNVLRSSAYAAAGLALALQGSVLAGGGVSISSYGQRALLIQGGGQSVLLNPYRAVGCAAGLPALGPGPAVCAVGVAAASWRAALLAPRLADSDTPSFGLSSDRTTTGDVSR